MAMGLRRDSDLVKAMSGSHPGALMRSANQRAAPRFADYLYNDCINVDITGPVRDPALIQQ